MTRLPIYILAGGRSRRFGSDKARAVLNGQTLLARVAMMLEPVATSITVVADRAGKYEDLGFRTIADRRPGLGPLAGLEAALHDRSTGDGWLLLCCCDALVIQRAWLDQLLSAPRDQHDAVAFHGDYWQPMPALYAATAQPTVSALLSAGDRSMQRLLNQLTCNSQPLPHDWPDVWQANSRHDLNSHRVTDGEK